MNKIRINELARQLQVSSREVIAKLHELQIAEKVGHSSSINNDTAEQLRRYYRDKALHAEKLQPRGPLTTPPPVAVPPKTNVGKAGKSVMKRRGMLHQICVHAKTMRMFDRDAIRLVMRSIMYPGPNEVSRLQRWVNDQGIDNGTIEHAMKLATRLTFEFSQLD